MYHPNELDNQIENLRTLQESYDQISTAAEAYNTGKVQLAQNLNSKGVPASASETLPKLAEKVGLIVQAPALDGESVTGQAIFPQPYVWNLIEEAYAHQNGEYAGLILAEFYKGYDTIPLSGADAYYTCDGDFYDVATTHVWHDENLGRTNRYVIYYLRNAYSPFVIGDASVCPRRMTVLGKVGTISSAIEGRITNIYNCGEIQDIQFAETQPWSTDVFLQINEHNQGGIFYNADNIVNLGVDIKDFNSGYIFKDPGDGSPSVSYFKSLIYCRLSGFKVMTQGVYLYAYTQNTYPQRMPNLAGLEITDLEECYCLVNPDCRLGLFANNMKTLRIPKLKKVTMQGNYLWYDLSNSYFQSLENIIVGAMETNLNLRKWKEGLVVDSETALRIANNIRSGILANISDRTGLSRLTLTLSTVLFNAVTAADSDLADDFLDKNWLLAGA